MYQNPSLGTSANSKVAVPDKGYLQEKLQKKFPVLRAFCGFVRARSFVLSKLMVMIDDPLAADATANISGSRAARQPDVIYHLDCSSVQGTPSEFKLVGSRAPQAGIWQYSELPRA